MLSNSIGPHANLYEGSQPQVIDMVCVDVVIGGGGVMQEVE